MSDQSGLELLLRVGLEEVGSRPDPHLLPEGQLVFFALRRALSRLPFGRLLPRALFRRSFSGRLLLRMALLKVLSLRLLEILLLGLLVSEPFVFKPFVFKPFVFRSVVF
jgi:hypothetical protein